jgi:hypothetical protein
MAKKMTAYQKKLEYNNAYNRENYRSFSIRYGKENEKKIISWLEKQDSVKGYITGLIEADMEKSKAEKKTAKKAPAKKTAAKKK